MRTFFSIMTTTLYYAFVGVLVVVAGALFAMHNSSVGGYELKIVRSGSMEPAIMTGSLIAIRPAESYQVGDVITFGRDTQTHIPTTHRIIEVRGEGASATYLTQGDANDNPDGSAVARDEVIGAVAYTLPKAGYVLDFARQPLGFWLLIVVPAAAVILDELLTIWEQVRSRTRREEDSEEEHATAPQPTPTPEPLTAQPRTPLRPVAAAAPPTRIAPARRTMDGVVILTPAHARHT
ncbi:signal peptidase I [Patescibacteria group bacterium]|jgi:signal peptidase|nr:signal peptidase I [Patescibacteria group bacterium]